MSKDRTMCNLVLDTKSGTHASQVAKLMTSFEKTLFKEKPNFVVVLGDNNSSLGFALTTSKLNIPLIHIEAGMRSKNWQMPEEKNRVIIDHLADINICYLPKLRSGNKGRCTRLRVRNDVFVMNNSFAMQMVLLRLEFIHNRWSITVCCLIAYQKHARKACDGVIIQ